MQKILVACEESQRVCIELRNLGHLAFSCDILPCSGNHPEWHLQEDVFKVIEREYWDMMIAFPPCTHIAVSGSRHFSKKRVDGRQKQGIDFFLRIANSNIDKIAIENPVGIMSTIYRKPDQIIQPWQFGDKHLKKTCIWLKNLPKLIPTKIVEPEYVLYNNKKAGHKTKYPIAWSKASNSIERSKTFPGIAKAMAEQFSA